MPLVLISLVLSLWALVAYLFSLYAEPTDHLIKVANWFNLILGIIGLLGMVLIPVCIALGLYFIFSKRKK